MQYVITFLEGVVSFLSPCMLPLLPVYVSYFAPAGEGKSRGLPRALAFVLGFTAVFCLLGLFAGALSAVLVRHRRALGVDAAPVGEGEAAIGARVRRGGGGQEEREERGERRSGKSLRVHSSCLRIVR